MNYSTTEDLHKKLEDEENVITQNRTKPENRIGDDWFHIGRAPDSCHTPHRVPEPPQGFARVFRGGDLVGTAIPVPTWRNSYFRIGSRNAALVFVVGFCSGSD
ncbi:hypothetical protein MHYP_G00089430 [Metynnis hypsauchen]